MDKGARNAVFLVAALTAWVCVGLVNASQDAKKTIHDGVFAAEQVEAGAEVFDDKCAECHPKNDFGPAYMAGWAGATVDNLVVQVEATMPYENPGTLGRPQYVEVLVYIFSLNGVSPGEEEMDGSSDTLNGIVIDGPFEWKGEVR